MDMEAKTATVETNLIYIGDFPCYGAESFPMVEITDRTISFTVERADVASEKETFLINKNEIMKLEACFQSTNPFFSLLLKNSAAEKIGQRMGFHRQKHWKFDTTKSVIRKASLRIFDTSTSWITFFINISANFCTVFYKNFLRNEGLLDPEKAFESPQTKNLFEQMLIHRIGQESHKEDLKNVAKKEPVKHSGVLWPVFKEDLLMIRKQAAYITYVSRYDANIEHVGPIVGRLFSDWLLSPELAKHAASLECLECKGKAQLACFICQVRNSLSPLGLVGHRVAHVCVSVGVSVPLCVPLLNTHFQRSWRQRSWRPLVKDRVPNVLIYIYFFTNSALWAELV